MFSNNSESNKRNEKIIDNLKFKYTPSTKFFIDGVCATGKTSISYKIPMKKYTTSITNRNTLPLAALSYYFGYLKFIRTNKNIDVFDRRPNNVFDWNKIWEIIIKYNNSNVYPSINDLIKEFKYLCRINEPFIEEYTINNNICIIVVDSNFNNNIIRLRNRNEGKDYIRSFWPLYIQIQYAFYKNLAIENNYMLFDVSDYDDINSCSNDIIKTITDIKQYKPTIRQLTPRQYKRYNVEYGLEFEKMKNNAKKQKVDNYVYI